MKRIQQQQWKQDGKQHSRKQTHGTNNEHIQKTTTIETESETT